MGPPKGNDADDDDLHDLLPADGYKNDHSQMQPLNLDHLSQGELDVPVKYQQGPSCSLLSLCCAYLTYACEYAPRFCCTLGVLGLLVPSYFLVMAVFLNPTEHFGTVVHDYSSIQSQYDLTVGNIDHWCIKGDNDSCRCEDPLQPQPKAEFRPWTKAHNDNKKIVTDLLEKGKTTPDIAFMGASVVEEMDGRWFGDKRDEQLEKLQTLFERNFDKANGGKVDAVALGIAGDTSASILWRLMHGEMPDDFNPKIWWLEVGMNDLGRSQCSEEVVVLGVLRIVEEIVNKKPDAYIVINSLLPMSELRGGLEPKKNDFKTEVQKRGENKGTRMRKRNKTSNNNGQKKEDRARGRTKTKGQHRQLRDRDRQTSLFRHNKPVKMSDHKTVQKKYNPVTHKERKLPLWTSITAINKELQKFSDKHDRVSFFDATRLFAERDGKYWFLQMDMISKRGHMTPAGFERWESAVLEKAKDILKDM